MARKPIDPADLAPLRDAVRERRVSSGLTQEQAADVLGLGGANYVFHLESRVVVMPDVQAWRRLTDALGISREQLLRELGYL